MLRQIKHGDWLILEDTETGEKTFSLPESKTRPFRNWSWIEKKDEAQSREEVPEQQLQERHSADTNESDDKRDK
jgi:hypothetical protein